MKPCSLPRRIGAMVYDSFLVGSIVFVAWFPIPLIPEELPSWLTLGFQRIYLISIIFLYFAWAWTRGGQTIGMRAWRIYLIGPGTDSIENRVSWTQAAKRFVFAIISFGLCGYGFWMGLFREDKMALHDLLSRTRIVFVPKPASPAPRRTEKPTERR